VYFKWVLIELNKEAYDLALRLEKKVEREKIVLAAVCGMD
jgi:hypothetical protein